MICLAGVVVLALTVSVPFHCLSLAFHCLTTAFPWPSTASPPPFLGLPLPHHCLALACHCLSLAFLGLPLPVHFFSWSSTALPWPSTASPPPWLSTAFSGGRDQAGAVGEGDDGAALAGRRQVNNNQAAPSSRLPSASICCSLLPSLLCASQLVSLLSLFVDGAALTGGRHRQSCNRLVLEIERNARSSRFSSG